MGRRDRDMTITDIINRVYFLAKTNATDYPAADMLISVNTAFNRVASLIMRADNRWQWDDTNQTDLPIGTTALVADQADYTLATSHLTIDRIEVKATGGTWHLLVQKDQQDKKRRDAVAISNTISGVSCEYDVIGSTLYLDPIPNYSQAASLKVYYTRGPVAFTSGDVSTGTKEPGFASIFHDLIPQWIAYDFALVNEPEKAAGFMNTITRMEAELKSFYGSRDRDFVGALAPKPIRFI